MPKSSEKKARKKTLPGWKELSDEIGLSVVAVLEAGGYIAFWHNYNTGVTVRLMYENDQETFAYEDPAEFRDTASEIDAWLKEAGKPKDRKKVTPSAYEKAKGR